MSEEAPFFGDTIVDDSRRLRSSGLVDLIHKCAPRIDAEGRLFTPREPKTVEVRAKLQTDEKKKRKIVGGAVICSYEDGTTRSFEVGMRNSRIRNAIAGGDPRTIEIIPGDPSALTPRQERTLGHLLRMSRGTQLNLREHVKSHMAKHPVVGALERGLVEGAALGTAIGGGHVLPSVAGAAGGAAGSLIESAVNRLARRSQEKSAEIKRKSAARRR